jgi:hypothetical protein
VRGPTFSNHFPAVAAANPRKTIATENIETIELKPQSPAEEATTPNSLVKGILKILHAYTEPIHRCIAIDAGGTNHRLNPGFATILSFEKKDFNRDLYFKDDPITLYKIKST